MEKDIQDVFLKIKEKKEKLKDLRSMCKELLDASMQYQEVNEEMKALREKRKRIIATVREQCANEMAEIEEITLDIASDEEMLTDIAMTKYTKGESIELKDQYDNTYEPVFSVKFKKSN